MQLKHSKTHQQLHLPRVSQQLLDFDWSTVEWDHLLAFSIYRVKDHNINFDFANPLHNLIYNESKKVESFFAGSSIASVAVHLMKPGQVIKPHVDPGEFFSRYHRVHLPLQTDTSIKMTIAGDSFHMGLGNFYEINNSLLHSIHNCSAVDRIHLVVDTKHKI